MGFSIKKAVKKVGGAVKGGAKKVGRAVKKGAKKAARQARRTAKREYRRAKKMAKKGLSMSGMGGGSSGGGYRGMAAGKMVTKGVSRQGGSGKVNFNTSVWQ